MKTIILMALLSTTIFSQDIIKEENLGGLSLRVTTRSIDWKEVAANMKTGNGEYESGLVYQKNIGARGLFSEMMSSEYEDKLDFNQKIVITDLRALFCRSYFEIRTEESKQYLTVSVYAEAETKGNKNDEYASYEEPSSEELKECAVKTLSYYKSVVGNTYKTMTIILDEKTTDDTHINQEQSKEVFEDEISDLINIESSATTEQ